MTRQRGILVFREELPYQRTEFARVKVRCAGVGKEFQPKARKNRSYIYSFRSGYLFAKAIYFQRLKSGSLYF